ncbi:ethanolamine ammonia-lyase subunit EutC [Amaricoccus macauensis]|uniref:ethanolamine ammonia-lyase subunit EutC n=1 Tax=Amaricoccus macauensis TaxID=57001 RepID=UPI003C7C87C5
MNDTPAKDLWARLRAATPARIGLGRSGAGLPTSANLEFQFAHARARDAVHRAVNFDALVAELSPRETHVLESAAGDRATYLRRPDLGRKLASGEAEKIAGGEPPDIVFVVADGLSADAVQAHAAAVIQACEPALAGLSIGPIFLVLQGRVAIGDEVGACLGAALVVMLIGERPGLTVADSLGAYLTFGPRAGRRDSERNCISNIHGNGGLSYDQAAAKIAWLAREALRLKLTGTGLKDDAPGLALGEDGQLSLPK